MAPPALAALATPGRRRRLAVAALLLAAAVAAALSHRLAQPRLHADEITYMEAVLESLVDGSIWPLDGRAPEGPLPFVNKPPLALWLIRLSFDWLGPTPFAARLPSTLATAATAGVLFVFGAALRSPRVGLLAALLFVFVSGPLRLHGYRSATPDALEILLVTLAVVGLEVWRRRRRAAALWLFVGATALTAWVKSPFAGVLILVYLLVSEVIGRRWGVRTPRLALTFAAAGGAWVAAWFLWLSTLARLTSVDTVTSRLLTQQYVRRLEGRLSESHVEGPAFYWLKLADDFGLLLLLPVAAAVLALLARRRQPAGGGDVAAVVVWSLLTPLLATTSASKLPWYIYTSYPAIALLLAISAERIAAALGSRRAVGWILVAAVAAAAFWRLPHGGVWPAAPRHRGPAACLPELRAEGVELALPADAARSPVRRGRIEGQRPDGATREARFFIRAVLWQQEVEPIADVTCHARVTTHPARDATALVPPHRRGRGVFLVDDCGGRARDRLLAADCNRPPRARR